MLSVILLLILLGLLPHHHGLLGHHVRGHKDEAVLDGAVPAEDLGLAGCGGWWWCVSFTYLPVIVRETVFLNLRIQVQYLSLTYG